MNETRRQYGFDELKNTPYEIVRHMVAIGTCSRETYYQIVQWKLANGQLKDAPRY